jgi:hypothetical protein
MLANPFQYYIENQIKLPKNYCFLGFENNVNGRILSPGEILETNTALELAKQVEPKKTIPYFMFLGSTGAGKDYAVLQLIKKADNIGKMVSFTMRDLQVRDGIKEVNGKAYYFVGEPDICSVLNDNPFGISFDWLNNVALVDRPNELYEKGIALEGKREFAGKWYSLSKLDILSNILKGSVAVTKDQGNDGLKMVKEGIFSHMFRLEGYIIQPVPIWILPVESFDAYPEYIDKFLPEEIRATRPTISDAEISKRQQSCIDELAYPKLYSAELDDSFVIPNPRFIRDNKLIYSNSSLGDTVALIAKNYQKDE